jgi:hypothetical protein
MNKIIRFFTTDADKPIISDKTKVNSIVSDHTVSWYISPSASEIFIPYQVANLPDDRRVIEKRKILTHYWYTKRGTGKIKVGKLSINFFIVC